MPFARWGRAVTGDNPLFILGAPRSGTSLLYRLLCQHPDVTYLNQYVRRVPGTPELSALNRLPRARKNWRAKTWFSTTGNAYVYGERRGWLQRGFPQPVEGEPFFNHWGLPAAVSPAAATVWDPSKLRVGVRRIQRADDGRRFASKRINHNRRVAALAKAFPGARFVHLVRDGRSAARSLVGVDWWDQCDVWAMGTTPPQWASAGGDPWELAVRHWAAEVSAIDEGLQGVPGDQMIVLRFEDLVLDLSVQMAGLMHFAQLAPHVEWDELVKIAALQTPSAPSPGRLDDRQLQTAAKWQAEVLDRHGYAPHRG